MEYGAREEEKIKTVIELDIEKVEIVCALRTLLRADWPEVYPRRSSELRPEPEGRNTGSNML
jgi:hypothetical protein